MNKKLFFFGVLICTWMSGCRDDLKNVDCSTISASYQNDIRPLVANSCNMAGCHNAGSVNGDYTSYAGLKAVADNGKLDDAVNIKKTMPKNGSLSVDDRKKIRCWIEGGALNN